MHRPIRSAFFLLNDQRITFVYLVREAKQEATHGERHCLSVAATYGRQRSSNVPRKFDFGEGLVGQVAINQQPMYMDDVPSDYLHIVSATGEREPAHIALIPILFQGHVRAVVELATFSPFLTVHRELIGQLAITLGVMIDAISANELTSKLLRETTELAQKLEKERAIAVQADQAKGDFLANMSHEIRMPMNGILGTTELILDSGMTPAQQQYAETIYQSSELLLALINDILDFTKTEAGELTLDMAPFDLLSVVEDVAELLAPKAIKKMIDLSVRFIPGTPRFVVGDSVRVLQVLCNLIGNAIKFTENGYVLVTVEQIDDHTIGEDDLRFRLSIQDTGIGISKDKLDRVFERFAQADGSTTRRYGGTGLGLAIAKMLAELMGGTIIVESAFGEGSTFSFTLKLRRDPNLRDAEPDRSILEGVRLLVVDDLEVNRSILCERPGVAGMVCKSARGSQEALEILRDAHRMGIPFEVVILDYMMPEENGVRLAEKIGSDPNLAPTVQIMLSSACVEIEPMSKAKISAFLTKPARQMQLLDTLSSLMAAKLDGHPLPVIQARDLASGSSTPKSPAEAALSGLRVLLVEDNRINRQLAETNLILLDCMVTTAEHGKEAVALVHEMEFDIIPMDCQMPIMDGFEATQIISNMMADHLVSRTPIIAVTANAMTGDRERCLEAGMNDYAAKPIRKKTLIHLLTRWCMTKESQAASDQDQTEPSSAAAEMTEGPSSAAVDRDLLAATQDMMGDQFPVILEFFLEDAAQYFDQIAAGVASKDAKVIAAAAHPLKSSSRGIGACALSEIARSIEEGARLAIAGDGDPASIEPIAQRLEPAFAEARSILESVIGQGGVAKCNAYGISA